MNGSEIGAVALERHPVPLWWKVAFWTVSAAWVTLQFPFGYNLQAYLFHDSGWALTADALLSEGQVPTRDFAYFYGLLTLVVDRAWFAAFGATPKAQVCLCLLCAAAATHATVRFAQAVRLRRLARWLLLVCMPLAVLPGFYATPAHALEYALLINAVALQARGRYATALVLATVCLFVKPALTAVYGVILVGLILFGPRAEPARWTVRLRELLPAAGVGLGIAILLVARFGFEPLAATLVPIDAARLYAVEHYGFFFGTGRRFWFPESIAWWYYPHTQAGFWLVATLVLLAGAIAVLRRGRGPAAALIVTCAALHLVFILFFFGNKYSWGYYSYVLIFGVCGVADRIGLPDGDWRLFDRVRVATLIPLAALGQSYPLLISLAMLVNALVSPLPSRTETTADLMASTEDQKSWARVREIAAHERLLIFTQVGAGHVLMPELDSPRSWYLLHPIARPAEIERLRNQIRAADWLLIPIGPVSRLNWWMDFDFNEQLAPFKVVEKYESFQLARRIKAKP